MLFSDKDLKDLLSPLVIEQVLVMLVGMVDTVMVSSVGETAVSGVALVDMVNYLVITVLTALTTGGAVILSQYLGSGQPDKAEFSAGQLMTVSALFSSGIALVCVLGRRAVLRLFFGAVEPAVMDAALTYFFVTACSFPFLGIYNAAAAQFRAMGRTNITMYVSALMNVLNIAGDLTGVFLLRAGVLGVAVPTLISRAVAAVLLSALAFRPGGQVRLSFRSIFAWDRGEVHCILRIAVPGGIENGLFALGRVLVTSIVSHFGTVQIAANGVANSIDQIAIIVVNAVNLAIITVVGQCVGAREYEQAEHCTKRLMKISYLYTAALGGMVCLALPLLLRLYDLELSPCVWPRCSSSCTTHWPRCSTPHPSTWPTACGRRGTPNIPCMWARAVCWCSAWARRCCLGWSWDGASSAYGPPWGWTGWPGPCASPCDTAKRAGGTAALSLDLDRRDRTWDTESSPTGRKRSASWAWAPAPSVWPGRKRLGPYDGGTGRSTGPGPTSSGCLAILPPPRRDGTTPSSAPLPPRTQRGNASTVITVSPVRLDRMTEIFAYFGR